MQWKKEDDNNVKVDLLFSEIDGYSRTSSTSSSSSPLLLVAVDNLLKLLSLECPSSRSSVADPFLLFPPNNHNI